MKKIVLSGLILFTSLSVQALTKAERHHLTVESVTVQAIPDETPLQMQSLTTQADDGGSIKDVGVILDAIVNIGQRIWTIAEKNKPVINHETQTASGMPDGITDWKQLQNWQPTQGYSYRVVYTNLYGTDVVDFTYRVVYTPGGNYRGQGHYLMGATVQVANLDVAWGYTFSSSVEVPTVMNRGTSENPVAALQINLHWSVDTVVKHSESRASFFLDGYGGFQIIE